MTQQTSRYSTNAGSFDVNFTVHHEGETWWAEATSRISVAADTREELDRLMREVAGDRSWIAIGPWTDVKSDD